MLVHLELTGECNLTCTHCYNSKYASKRLRDKELSHEDWLRIIHDANQLGCERFTFSGGEPLMYQGGNHAKFIELLNACSAQVILLTNGHYLDEKLFLSLVETGKLKAIRLSLDGLESHDQFRPGGDHHLVLKRIKMINDLSKIPVAVVTMIHNSNVAEIGQMYDLLKTMGIARWGIDIPFLVSNYGKAKNKFATPTYGQTIAVLKSLLVSYFEDGKPFQLGVANVYKSELSTVPYQEFDIDAHPCCYRDITCIKPNGAIHVCAAYNREIAHVCDSETLKETQAVAKSHPFYAMKVRDIPGCSSCRYLQICGGGCRADAYFLTGSESSPDPRNCALLPLVEKEIFPILPDEERKILMSLCVADGTIPS